MRLIDADVILDYLENNEIMRSIDEINKANETYSATPLYDFVKNIPTAYDVDRVLEQLEYARVPNTGIAGYHKVVEIVKGGGTDGMHIRN